MQREVKGIETHISLREVDIEKVFITPIYLLEADNRQITDHTGNPIRDHWGAAIFDE